jgi:hypothetical protein
MSGRRPPTSGVVGLAALDVRRKPDHASEMGSQLLMGESVRVIRSGAKDRWLLVENLADRYRGWVRSWGLVLTSARRMAVWSGRARGRPIPPWIEVRDLPGGGSVITPLFWGGRVIPGRLRGRFRRVELPDGVRGWVRARDLALGDRRARPLAARVRDLLGVPYLWGGRTPAGLDCSGLSQMLLAEQGLQLPRDAGDQERACRPLGAGESPRAGDLAFFGARGGPAAHVGVVLGSGLYIHARGRVRMNHLKSSNILFDKELGAQFRSISRPGHGGCAGL